MKHIILFATISMTLFFSLTSLGQECPRSIEIDRVLRGNLSDWNALDKASVHLLSGLNVVGGKLHADPGENGVLAPISDSESGYVWPFSSEIGEEFWMLCRYRDTQVRLSRRIMAKVTQCRIKKTGSDVGEAVRSVRAYCD